MLGRVLLLITCLILLFFRAFTSTDFIALSIFTLACVVPFGNLKLNDHFDFVKAHLYDLKDKKISALAFLIASSIRLISLSVPAAFAAYAVAFALNGWEFGLYLQTTLLAALFALNLFQVSKIISLCTKDMNTFNSAYLAYGACSLIFSGILAAPVDVHPDVMRIFMYLSLQFWSFAGTLVGWLSLPVVDDTSYEENDKTIVKADFAQVDASYFEDIKNPIIAAELVPRYAQYELLTNPRRSLLVLLFAFAILSLIEYIILLGTTSKKLNQYESRKDDTEPEIMK